MSVNYYANAVIGVEVSSHKLYRKKVIPHTAHPVPENARFCPVCGKAATITKDEPVFNEVTNTIGDRFAIYWGTDRKFAVIGRGISMGPYDNEPGYICLNDVMLYDDIKEALSSFGLWDENKYGLYAVLYCSY